MNDRSLVLDTNAAVAILNRWISVSTVLAGFEELLLPLIVIGELEFGARRSGRPRENLEAIEGLLLETTLLLPDRKTASHYAEIRTRLRGKGRPIPANDEWIAALALQYELPLLTRDAHFQHVDGLTIIEW
jgi:tRNA(fMet)-specific endonuclease VapC